MAWRNKVLKKKKHREKWLKTELYHFITELGLNLGVTEIPLLIIFSPLRLFLYLKGGGIYWFKISTQYNHCSMGAGGEKTEWGQQDGKRTMGKK